MRTLAACSTALVVVILLAACAGASSPAAPSSPGPSASAQSTTGAVTACGVEGYPHQAAELEAVLPKKVAGRDLTVWSMVGDCWLKTNAKDPAAYAEGVQILEDYGVDLNDLRYGIAGRSGPADPPYFVFAIAEPANPYARETAFTMLILGGGFKEGTAALDSSDWSTTTLADHSVWVGTSDMLIQSEHQRGTPYLVETDDFTFFVITDEEAWAAEAIRSTADLVGVPRPRPS